MNARVAAERLDNQRLTRAGARTPEDLVAWMGAVQAQEYPWAKWALALRMPPGATDARIERALDDGLILRTHVLRPTWHFVAASDIDWMLTLSAPNVGKKMAYAYRLYELDPKLRMRAASLMERALRDGRHLTRAELAAYLARAGVVAKGVRLALLTVYAELERVMCSGARRGTQSTYALLATRAPSAPKVSRDEALAELTRRYFRSHGPATIRDFTWWSGLGAAEARRGLDAAGAASEAIDGLTYWTVGRRRPADAHQTSVHLLPMYDEYFVAYRDLNAVPRANGLQATLVAGGQAVGAWEIAREGDQTRVDVEATRPLNDLETSALGETAARYGRFLGTTVSVSGRSLAQSV